jgi:hypothetical protein
MGLTVAPPRATLEAREGSLGASLGWRLGFALAGLACSGVAVAEQPPEFLLKELGARVVLDDKSWVVTGWRPDGLEAERRDGGARLFVWGAPVQQSVQAAHLPAWGRAQQRVLEKLGAEVIVPRASAVEEGPAGPVARVRMSFEEAAKGARSKGAAEGATLATEGHMVHLALVGRAAQAKALDGWMDGLVAALDVQAPPASIPERQVVEVAGARWTLSDGWRAPLASEASWVAEQGARLGVLDAAACVWALRPRPGSDADLMAACAADTTLGVVDAESFGDVEGLLHERIFGKAPVPEGVPLPLVDRLALRWQLPTGDMGVGLVVVPTSAGILKLWAITRADSEAAATREAATLLSATAGELTFDGPHPVSVGAWLAWVLSYRPTSPLVVGPGLLLLGAVVGAIWFLATARPSRVDDLA